MSTEGTGESNNTVSAADYDDDDDGDDDDAPTMSMETNATNKYTA